MPRPHTPEDLLAILRERVGASTQSIVAAELGISRSMLNEVLSGRRNVTERVAEAMGFRREVIYRSVEIQEIIDRDQYAYYGLRAVTNLLDMFTADWLTRNGYSLDRTVLQVGQIAPNSYRWDDGDLTPEMLAGTSPLAIADLDSTLTNLSRLYPGSQIVLLGSNQASGGEDHNELVMQHATVLSVIE